MGDEPVWRLKFYGTRGSIPVCENGFQWYGGNTTCIYIELINSSAQFTGIIDAGSGIRNLGRDFVDGKEDLPMTIFMFFTHFHWDHLQGFPFFAPAYSKRQKISIFAPNSSENVAELKQIFEIPMQEEYFPVKLSDMGADFSFLTKDDVSKCIQLTGLDNLSINKHDHPGGAYGYRFEFQGKSIVICTDVEHRNGLDQGLIEFSKGADLLIHDAQYTSEELIQYKNWGHSSYQQAIEVAEHAGVSQLILTHHDPSHDDEFLFAKEKHCLRLFPDCSLARDGMEIFI